MVRSVSVAKESGAQVRQSRLVCASVWNCFNQGTLFTIEDTNQCLKSDHPCIRLRRTFPRLVRLLRAQGMTTKNLQPAPILQKTRPESLSAEKLYSEIFRCIWIYMLDLGASATSLAPTTKPSQTSQRVQAILEHHF